MSRLKGSRRLDLVVDLARRKREEADRILQESSAKLQQAKQGLEQLEAFLGEYIEETRLKQGDTLNSMQLQVPTAFIGRLRGSVSQQNQVVEHLARQHSEVEAWWRKLYARERAIIKLQTKLKDRESIVEEKQLQKQIDELWQNRPINHI